MASSAHPISDTSWRHSLHWVHWLVIALSLLLTLGAWYFTKQQVEEKTEQRFDRESSRVVELIVERMQKYEDAMWGGVAAIHSQSHGMDSDEWRRFSETLHIDTKYPGINGIGVITYVPPEKLENFLAYQRQSRPDFRIFPEHVEDEYWPITFIEPMATNFKALGLDMAHEANRFTAAKKARDSGEAQITGPIVLVQGAEKTPGFLFYAPFYAGSSTETVEERQNAFVGLVYAPFFVNKLMEGTLAQRKRHVSVTIHDGDDILYDEHAIGAEDIDPDPLFHSRETIVLYGRDWTFDIRTTQAFRAAAANHQPLMILFGGLIIDSLLLGLFILLSRSNQQASALAKRKSEMLAERESELQLIFDNVPVRIWYKDDENHILRLNKTAADSMGVTVAEAEGADTYDLFPAMAKHYHEEDLEVIQGGEARLGIVEEYTPKDGPHGWVRTDKVPYTDPVTGSSHILVIAQDITELMEAQKDNQRYIEDLERSNKELDEFAYIASHDLKEPLRGLHNHASYLEQRYADRLDEDGARKLDRIIYLTKRMEALINDLLHVSRLGRAELAMQPTDINTIVEDVRETLLASREGMSEETIDITIISPPLPTVICDATRVTELFRNLITNGLKYNDSPHKTIEIGVDKAKDSVVSPVFYVRDNGIGIDPQFHDEVFRIFKRLHKKDAYGGGTGSGLSFVKKIIDRHGGKIWLESQAGEGCIFYFTLAEGTETKGTEDV